MSHTSELGKFVKIFGRANWCEVGTMYISLFIFTTHFHPHQTDNERYALLNALSEENS